MKKKVKLFTTIASLCLAVALMAFGVYAATTVTATVSGKITFVATDVDVSLVSVKWYAENVKNISNTTKATAAVLSATSEDSGVYTLGDDLFVDSLDTEAKIYIICTVANASNQNDAELTAAITAADSQFVTKTNPTAVTVGKKAAGTATEAEITAVIGFKVADKTTTPANAYDFSVVFNAAKKA